MARLKSFLKNIDVDVAKRSHMCQHNNKHKIKMGDTRLSLKDDRTIEHFCVSCAKDSIRNDIAKLQNILSKLENESGRDEETDLFRLLSDHI